MLRRLFVTDALLLQDLNKVCLGYEAILEVTKSQLEACLQSSDHILLGAIDGGGHLVGYVHATLYQCLYFPPLLNILGLAVAPYARKKGFGRELMEGLEEQAKALGLAGIRLNSGIDRQEAHVFYQSLGYQSRPDQKRFLKLF